MEIRYVELDIFRGKHRKMRFAKHFRDSRSVSFFLDDAAVLLSQSQVMMLHFINGSLLVSLIHGFGAPYGDLPQR